MGGGRWAWRGEVGRGVHPSLAPSYLQLKGAPPSLLQPPTLPRQNGEISPQPRVTDLTTSLTTWHHCRLPRPRLQPSGCQACSPSPEPCWPLLPRSGGQGIENQLSYSCHKPQLSEGWALQVTLAMRRLGYERGQSPPGCVHCRRA